MRYVIAFCLLFWLLLFGACRSFGATGDIISAEVETNGWVLRVTVEGVATNGSFNFGFNDRYEITGSPATLYVSSSGFDDSGVSNRISRTLYATKQLRMPYPNQSNNDISASGSDAVIRVALSDYIHPDCTAVINIPAGWYAGNNAATALAVVNGSATAHPKAIANWSWPGYQRITGNTMTLRVVAFHRSGQQFRPVRLVRFIATGATSGVKTTNDVLYPTIDRNMPDATPVIEYIADVDISSFTQGELIRCDFKAFPWVGDSGSVLDTTDNANSQPTPLYSSITNVCDRLGTYGNAFAVVDPVNGVAGGKVSQTFTASLTPFLNINAASAAMAASNNVWYSRNNVGGGTIYLTNGNHNWTGASAAVGGTPDTWVTIAPYPGALRSDVVISNTLGSKDISDRVLLTNLTITATNTSPGTFDTIGQMWLDHCYVSSTSGVPFLRVTNSYWTHCEVPNLQQGFKPVSVNRTTWGLLRGNTMGAGVVNTMPYTLIGNVYNENPLAANVIVTDQNNSGVPHGSSIIAYNRFLNMGGNTGIRIIYALANSNTVLGVAIVQNLIEVKTNNSYAALWVAADSSTGHATNVLIWNNTIVGQRANLAYNDVGSDPKWRVLWSVKNNSFDDDNIKCDTFTTGNGGRIGNWSQLFAVGHSGNFRGNVGGATGVAVPDFSHTNSGGFAGLNSIESDVSFSTNYQRFADHKASLNSATPGTGGGNYRVQSSSPILQLRTEQLLPYDIEGRPRGRKDPPGAHSSASPRRGDLF